MCTRMQWIANIATRMGEIIPWMATADPASGLGYFRTGETKASLGVGRIDARLRSVQRWISPGS